MSVHVLRNTMEERECLSTTIFVSISLPFTHRSETMFPILEHLGSVIDESTVHTAFFLHRIHLAQGTVILRFMVISATLLCSLFFTEGIETLLPVLSWLWLMVAGTSLYDSMRKLASTTYDIMEQKGTFRVRFTQFCRARNRENIGASIMIAGGAIGRLVKLTALRRKADHRVEKFMVLFVGACGNFIDLVWIQQLLYVLLPDVPVIFRSIFMALFYLGVSADVMSEAEALSGVVKECNRWLYRFHGTINSIVYGEGGYRCDEG